MSSSGRSGQNSTSRATTSTADITTITQTSSETITDIPLPLAELLGELSQTYDLSDISLDKRFRLVQLWNTANKMKEMKDGRLEESKLSEHQSTRLSLIQDITKEWDADDHYTKNPYDELRTYTQTTQLPPMPWRSPETKKKGGRRTKKRTDTTMLTAQSQQTAPNPSPRSKGTTTERTPEKSRDLGLVQRIPMDEFDKLVRQFSNDHIPHFGIDSEGKRVKADREEDGESLGAINHQYRNHRPSLAPPNSEERVRTWIDQVVLSTAARILHVSDPNTTPWVFSQVVGKGTQQILSDLAWQKEPPANSDDVPVRRLIVEAKSPWTMPLSVLQKFVDLKKLPTLAELRNMKSGGKPNEKEKFSEEQKVWAQLYDYCHTQRRHYFVLTTYERWVFGVFSLNFTSARVSDIIPYSRTEPTVLECLTYWVQSSMFVPGCFEIPMFGPNDIGPAASLEPQLWESSWSIWRSHGFEELRGAIFRLQFQANQIRGKDQHSSHYTSDKLPPEEENTFRSFLAKSTEMLDDETIPDVARLGKETLRELLGMQWEPYFSWVLRLTWLALVQRPRYLGSTAYQLEAAFVDAASGVGFHPIHAATVTEHVARKANVGTMRTKLKLPKFLPSQLHSSANESPSGVQPTDDLEKLYQFLLTEETTWVLLEFLDLKGVNQVKRALSIAGYASFNVAPLLSVSASDDIGADDARITTTSASSWSRPSTPGCPVTPDSLDGLPLFGAEFPELFSSNAIVDAQIRDSSSSQPLIHMDRELPEEPVGMEIESSSFIFDAHMTQEPLPYHEGQIGGRSPVEVGAFGTGNKVQPKLSGSIPAAMELGSQETHQSPNHLKAGPSSGRKERKRKQLSRANSATSTTEEATEEPAGTGPAQLINRRVSKRLKSQS
ncbi:hypothetical protein FS837_012309 [Tulasnella sp. UAMH 9824]|nr:hypothetical protein FS837_012309 [Tulasnella sp. UAMH 9824]